MSSESQAKYVVILDAGSGGTRPYIYTINPTTGKVEETKDKLVKKDGGIHKVKSVSEGEEYLIKFIFEPVCKTLHTKHNTDPKDVELYLLATGGVRDLPSSEKEDLFKWLNICADKSGLKKMACRDILGTEEAYYGWVAANYSRNHDSYEYGYAEMGGASVQIVFPLKQEQRERVEQAKKVVQDFNSKQGDEKEGVNVVALMKVRSWIMFLASYRLGSRVGYEEYEKLLLTSKDPRIWESANPNVFWDPSKRVGYTKKVGEKEIKGGGETIMNKRDVEVEDGEDDEDDEDDEDKKAQKRLVVKAILERQARLKAKREEDGEEVEGVVDEEEAERVKAQKRRALTNIMASKTLYRLHPRADVTKPLDKYVRELDFIGGADFYWSTSSVFKSADHKDGQDLDYKKYYQEVTKSSRETNDAFCDSKPPGQTDRVVLENSIFTAMWVQRVLHGAFGVMLDSKMKFTPYNGIGGRFSWTLGMAVVLADESLQPKPLSE